MVISVCRSGPVYRYRSFVSVDYSYCVVEMSKIFVTSFVIHARHVLLRKTLNGISVLSLVSVILLIFVELFLNLL